MLLINIFTNLREVNLISDSLLKTDRIYYCSDNFCHGIELAKSKHYEIIPN